MSSNTYIAKINQLTTSTTNQVKIFYKVQKKQIFTLQLVIKLYF